LLNEIYEILVYAHAIVASRAGLYGPDTGSDGTLRNVLGRIRIQNAELSNKQLSFHF